MHMHQLQSFTCRSVMWTARSRAAVGGGVLTSSGFISAARIRRSQSVPPLSRSSCIKPDPGIQTGVKDSPEEEHASGQLKKLSPSLVFLHVKEKVRQPIAFSDYELKWDEMHLNCTFWELVRKQNALFGHFSRSEVGFSTTESVMRKHRI